MVNISLRNSETQGDRKPTHRKVPRAVMDALAHAQDCVREYNDRIDEMFTPGTPHPDWTEIARLGSQANAAEMALVEARDAALNPCKHENTSMTGCMWFSGGEVDDDFETVCEDCGARLEGGE